MKKVSFVLAFAMIFVLCAAFCSCQSTDGYTIPDLDAKSMKMLCIGNINSLEGVDSIRHYDSRIDGGFSAESGEKSIERPTVHQYFIAYSDELGSPVALPWATSSYKDSFMLSADFYAFDGELSELEYKYTYFDTESLFNCTVQIYNGSELVGKLFFDPYVFISRDWIENFVRELESTLVCVSLSRTQTDATPLCLTLGNVENSELCARLIGYSASISGGWYTEFWKSTYKSTASTVQMSFIGAGTLGGGETGNIISLSAEFYEFEGEVNIDDLRVESDDIGQIKIFIGDRLVGLVNYTSDQPIDADMLGRLVIEKNINIYTDE